MSQLLFISIFLFSCNKQVEEEGARSSNKKITDSFNVYLLSSPVSSENQQPTIRVAGNFLVGQKVYLYRDKNCSIKSAYNYAANKSYVDLTPTALVARGVYDFRVRVENRNGVLSNCSQDGAFYDFIKDLRSDPPFVYQDPSDLRKISLSVKGVQAYSVVSFYSGIACITKLGDVTANSLGQANWVEENAITNTDLYYTANTTINGASVGCTNPSEKIAINAIPESFNLSPGQLSISNNPFPRFEMNNLKFGHTVSLHKTIDCSDIATDEKLVTQTTDYLYGYATVDQATETYYITQYNKSDSVSDQLKDIAANCSGSTDPEKNNSISYTLNLIPQALNIAYATPQVGPPLILNYEPEISASNIFDKTLATDTDVNLYLEPSVNCTVAPTVTVANTSIAGRVQVIGASQIVDNGTYSWKMSQVITGLSPHTTPKVVNIQSRCSTDPETSITNAKASTATLSENFTPFVAFPSEIITPSSNPFPKFKITNLEIGASLDLYSDASCTTTVPIVGGTITVTNSIETITLLNPQPIGSVNYYVGQTPLDHGAVECSSVKAYEVDGTNLVPMLKPGINVVGTDPNISFRVNNTLSLSTIDVYANLVDCNSESNKYATTNKTTGIGYIDFDLTNPLPADGVYQFHFREDDTLNSGYKSECTTNNVQYKLDRVPSNLKIIANTGINKLKPKFSVSNIITGASLKIYQGASCGGGLIATLTAGVGYIVNGASVEFTWPNELQTDVTHTFSVIQNDGSDSTCSNNRTYMLNAAPRVSVRADITNPGSSLTPTLTISNLINNGARDFRVFNSATCAGGTEINGPATFFTNTSNLTSVDVTIPLGLITSDGTVTFSANQDIGGAGISNCSTFNANYIMDGKLTSVGLKDGVQARSQSNLSPEFKIQGHNLIATLDTTIELHDNATCTNLLGTSAVLNIGDTLATMQLSPRLTADGIYKFYFKQNVSDNPVTFTYTSDCSVTYAKYTLDGRPILFSTQLQDELNDITPTVAINDNYFDPDEFDTNTTVSFFTDPNCTTPVDSTAAVVPNYLHGYTIEQAGGGSEFLRDATNYIYAKVSRAGAPVYTSDCSSLGRQTKIAATPGIRLDPAMTEPITIGVPNIELSNVEANGVVNIYVYNSVETDNGCTGVVDQVVTHNGVLPSFASSNETFLFKLDSGFLTANGNYKIYAGRDDPFAGGLYDDDNECSEIATIEVQIPDGMSLVSASPGELLSPTIEILGTSSGIGQTIEVWTGGDPCISKVAPAYLVSAPTAATDTATNVDLIPHTAINSDGEYNLYGRIYEGPTGSPTFENCKPVLPEIIKYTLAGAPKVVTPTLSNDATPTFSVSGMDTVNANLQLELFDNVTNCNNIVSVADEVMPITPATQGATQDITWTTALVADGNYDFYIRTKQTSVNYVSDCYNIKFELSSAPASLNVGGLVSLTTNDFTPDVTAGNLVITGAEQIHFYKDSCGGALLGSFPISSVLETFTLDLSTQQAPPTADDNTYNIYANQDTDAGLSACTSTPLNLNLSGEPKVILSGTVFPPYYNPRPSVDVSNLLPGNSVVLYLDENDGGDSCDYALSDPLVVTLETETVNFNLTSDSLPYGGTYKLAAKQTQVPYDSNCSSLSSILNYSLDLDTSSINIVDSTMPINPIVRVLNTIDNSIDNAKVNIFDDNCISSVIFGGVGTNGTDGFTDIVLNLTNDGPQTFKYQQTYDNPRGGAAPNCSVASSLYNLDMSPNLPTVVTASPNNKPDPTITFSNLIAPLPGDNNLISVFSDSGCTAPAFIESFNFTNATFPGNPVNITFTNALIADGTQNLYTRQDYTRSNTTVFQSNCSALSADYELDGLPGNLTLVPTAPNDLNPQFTLDNLITDASVHFYIDATECTNDTNDQTALLTDPGTGTSRTISTDLTTMNDGEHTFYFNQHKTIGATTYRSNCSSIAYSLNRGPSNITFVSGMIRPAFTVDLTYNNGDVYIYTDEAACIADITNPPVNHRGTNTVNTLTGEDIAFAAGEEFILDGTHDVFIKQVNAALIHTGCTGTTHVVDGTLGATHLPSVTGANPTSPDYNLGVLTNIYDYSNVAPTPEVEVYHVPLGTDPTIGSEGCTGGVLVGSGPAGNIGDNSTTIAGLNLGNVNPSDTATDYRLYTRTKIDGIGPGGVGYKSKCSAIFESHIINTTPVFDSTSISDKSSTPSIGLSNLTIGSTVNAYSTDNCAIASLLGTFVPTAIAESIILTDLKTHPNFGDGNPLKIYTDQEITVGVAHTSRCTAAGNALTYTLNATPTDLDIAAPVEPFNFTQTLELTNPINWLHDLGNIRIFLDKTGKAACDPTSAIILNDTSLLETDTALSIDFDALAGNLNQYSGTYKVSLQQDIDVPYTYVSGNFSNCISEADTAELVVDYKPQLVFQSNSTNKLADTDIAPVFTVNNAITGVDQVQLYRSADCSGAALATTGSILPLSTGTIPNVTDNSGTLTDGTYYYTIKVVNTGLLDGPFVSDCSAPALYDFNGATLSLVTSTPNTIMTPIVTVGNLTVGDSVTLYRDSSCINAVGTQTASAATLNFTSTSLPTNGIHNFHATKIPFGGSTPTSCSVVGVAYDLNIEPSSLTLLDVGPIDINPTPTITVSGVLPSANIKLYSDSLCANQVSSASTGVGQTSINITSGSLSTDGVYNYKVTQHASGFDSLCSTATVSYEYISKPSDIQLLTNNPSGDDTPTFRVFGVNTGAAVRLFTDSSCSAASQSGQVIATGNFADVSVNIGKVTTNGVYRFYAKQVLSGGSGASSQCSTLYSDYTFQSSLGSWTLKLNDEQNIDQARLGDSVAIIPNLAVAGSPTDNKAYVYRYDGSKWEKEVELGVISGVSFGGSDEFGKAVAISPSGLKIAVGAPGTATGQGKVYIFDYDGSVWTYRHAIVKNVYIYDGIKLPVNNDNFGNSIAIVGNQAFVGMPGHTSNNSAVSKGGVVKVSNLDSTPTQEYIDLNPLTNLEIDGGLAKTFKGTWNASTNTPPLTESVGTEGDFYYTSIAGAQSIGAASAVLNLSLGEGMLFTGGEWTERVLPTLTGRIGEKISYDGITVLASAPDKEEFYAFETNNDLTRAIKFTTPVSSIDFAKAISLSGDTIAVGAPASNSDKGSVYLYNINTLTIPYEITAHSRANITPNVWPAGGKFGDQVDIEVISSFNLVVGAPAANSNNGAAYILNGTNFAEETYIVPFDLDSNSNEFGSAVGTTGGQVIIGAPGADTDDAGAESAHGRVYIYQP